MKPYYFPPVVCSVMILDVNVLPQTAETLITDWEKLCIGIIHLNDYGSDLVFQCFHGITAIYIYKEIFISVRAVIWIWESGKLLINPFYSSTSPISPSNPSSKSTSLYANPSPSLFSTQRLPPVSTEPHPSLLFQALSYTYSDPSLLFPHNPIQEPPPPQFPPFSTCTESLVVQKLWAWEVWGKVSAAFRYTQRKLLRRLVRFCFACFFYGCQ